MPGSYICDICQKSFGTRHSLNMHKRVHTNNRPFICDVCLAPFKNQHHLKGHKLSKHGGSLPTQSPQPVSSGFNPQFQPSNVSTGDQPGTSGLSRTQAGSPIRHQGQQQHTQPAQVSGATSFQRTTHPRPAPYFPAQPHVDLYPQYYPTYQEDDGYLHVYDPKTGRFPKRS
ncbi:C2H2 transcription factor Crz1 [Xenorhabdus beddingii]|uniref:C2H2 transcription factor Crz1 n=1 Tax=Xenorhabdus beddingii TaxID=40578 RepID=A0A1Y2S8S9_9GAMM|nr:C2H2-type zinc finger protein [Xenorhabdus beddingii]OTA14294.1 C2H2 transcription factor Crz1 [Xenorhabdus beddingii]